MSVVNIDQWLDENKKHMAPPVCNRMMHNEGQMKVMFVIGPNNRKDFHIDCGEELFLQLKGDMCVRVVEQGKHRDVIIKEGEMFLLPARVPHSPQRYADTVGLVLERTRHPDTELDGVRYYTEEGGKFTLKELYEAWFYCSDLGTQLAPLIKGFFASEQYKTGKPVPGTIPSKKPVVEDTEVQLESPFDFQAWIDRNRKEIDEKGYKDIFSQHYQFKVSVFGRGENSDKCDSAETWIVQREGESTVTVEGQGQNKLRKGDTLLVSPGKKFTVGQKAGGLALVMYQDPTKANTWRTA